MKALMFILIFLILCGLVIVNNNQLCFSEKEDLKTFGKLYLGWADQIFKNAKILTGNAINMKWVPETPKLNETLSKI